jgi:hypothetical protein
LPLVTASFSLGQKEWPEVVNLNVGMALKVRDHAVFLSIKVMYLGS